MKIFFIRLIATSQLLGALAAMFVVSTLTLRQANSLISMLFSVCILLACSVVAVLAVKLWSLNRWGKIGSIVVQFIQVPSFVASTVYYKFVFGFGVFIRVRGDGNTIDVDLGSKTHMALLEPQSFFYIGINVWALFAIWMIYRSLGNIKDSTAVLLEKSSDLD